MVHDYILCNVNAVALQKRVRERILCGEIFHSRSRSILLELLDFTDQW